MTIDQLQKEEEKLINKHLQEDVNHDVSKGFVFNDIYIRQTQNKVHAEIVNFLIYIYLKKKCGLFNEEKYSEYFNYKLGHKNQIETTDINISEIPSLCEKLHVLYLNSAYSINKAGRTICKKSKDNLIENGAVYTPKEIAYNITYRTLKNLPTSPGLSKILDFATGTGRFYHQIINVLNELYDIDADYSILNNIYAIDIDPVAVNICRATALARLSAITLENICIVCNHIVCRNALISDLFNSKEALSVSDLDGLHFGKFDAIVSNPPYLVLKPNKRKMDEYTVSAISQMASYFRSSELYHYSIEGMLNLYQLSIEAMLRMLKSKGQMGIICPSTLFADKSASKLRKHLLSHNNLSYIRFFTEEDALFENVTQATCIFHLEHSASTADISISNNGKDYTISLNDIQSLFEENWEIPSVEPIEWSILKKLQGIPKLKDHKQLRNRRGELDLTLSKSYVTTVKTPYRLVRGNMITAEGIKDINHEFVLADFIKKRSDDYISFDLGKKRLICQQISNQSQKKRLNFIYCEPNDILGNSCNYISSSEESLSKVIVLLNSALLNWRFKLTSTNNNINNYELDELPIIKLENITNGICKKNHKEQDICVCKLYGLNEEETEFILKQTYDSL